MSLMAWKSLKKFDLLVSNTRISTIPSEGIKTNMHVQRYTQSMLLTECNQVFTHIVLPKNPLS